MKKENITVWLTKYALTVGVEKIEAELFSEETVAYGVPHGYTQYAHRKDWHRTPEAALKRAEEMREAKIISLNKSIAKMKKLEFVIPK